MRPVELVYEEIAMVNKSKRDLILQYFAAQESSLVSVAEKIDNCTKIYYELRKKNDRITELECEVVSLLAYAI
jgi:hypothetical protein